MKDHIMARHHKSHHKSHHEISGGEYAGYNERRKQEMEDAGMINEDRSAIANMPQGVMMKEYPKDRDYMPEDLDDTIRGVDSQMDMDNRKRKQHFRPHKY
jgi:hypothetical protein